MAPRYSASSYDDYFCLKPPGLLWLAVLYFSRAFVLLALYDLSSLTRISPDTAAMLRGTVSVYSLAPSLVAAPLLYALFRRTPSSTKLVRWLWAHARAILTVAGILDCAVSIGASGIIGADAATLAPAPLLAALFDVYFLVYILATRQVRDAFADFPPPEPKPRGVPASGAQRRR